MTQIIDRLWIGNWQEAKGARGFRVVTVAIDAPFRGHHVFGLYDGPGNTQALFDEAVKAVVELHRAGHQVVVHCVSGRSRSGAVAVRAIGSLRNIGLCEAYDLTAVKHDRLRIHPALSELLLQSFKSA